MSMRYIWVGLIAVLAVLVVSVPNAAFADDDEDDGFHRLALQVSDNDPKKMTSALNVAANVSRHYSGLGEEVEIKIVVFDGGLNMVRKDRSPVGKRLQSFAKGMPNVEFLACENTILSVARNESRKPELFENVEIVPAGVVTLIELDEDGWTIVRP